MELYVLFIKTVFTTAVTLLSAAAMLFGSVEQPEPRPPGSRWRQASFERQHQAVSRRDAVLDALVAVLEAREPGRRGLAARATDDAGAQDANALAAGLRNAEPLARAAAACQLERLGSRAAPAIAALITVLADASPVAEDVCGEPHRWSARVRDGDSTPGERAAAALAAIGADSIEPLIAAARGPHWVARKNAVWALGALEDARANATAIVALRDSEAPVRRSAAWALGALEAAEAVPALIGALRDADERVRAQAAWALGAIEDERATLPLGEALSDASARVRMQAAWALGAVESPAGVEALIRVLTRDAEPDVRSQAAWALGAIGDPRAAGALATALKDQDVNVRRQAAWALGAVGK
jgi:HEAT repeat protein